MEFIRPTGWLRLTRETPQHRCPNTNAQKVIRRPSYGLYLLTTPVIWIYQPKQIQLNAHQISLLVVVSSLSVLNIFHDDIDDDVDVFAYIKYTSWFRHKHATNNCPVYVRNHFV